MKRISLLLMMLLFFSCDINTAAEKTNIETSNEKFSVELLFTIDGCKVYGFNYGDTQTICICPCENNNTVPLPNSLNK